MTEGHESGWDLTDPLNPQPLIYPVCPDCGEPGTYTRFLQWTTGKFVWAWAKPPKVPKGCRHKSPMVIGGAVSDD